LIKLRAAKRHARPGGFLALSSLHLANAGTNIDAEISVIDLFH
jgi:hypothetical protein